MFLEDETYRVFLKDMRTLFRKNQELKTLLERLEQVKIQIVTIIRKEFRNTQGLTGIRGSEL